jgi:hemerythrin-like domain-containing protein
MSVGLTSTAYASSPTEWYDTTLLIPHEGIRHAALALLQGIRKISPVLNDIWKLKNWIRFWKIAFQPFVHEHHDNEELIFFPAFIDRAKDEVPKDRMAKDHKQLIELMNQIDSDIEEFEKKFIGNYFGNTESTEFKEILGKIETHLVNLSDHMNEHLAEEEKIFPPIMQKYSTEAEIQAVIQRIVKRSHPIDIVFGLIAEPIPLWSTPEVYQKFLHELPFVVRKIALKIWIPRYQKFKRETLGSLDFDVEPSLPKHSTCSIQ